MNLSEQARAQLRVLRRVAIGFGLSLVVLALFADGIRPSAEVSFGRNQFLLFVVGSVIALGALSGRRLPSHYRGMALLGLNTLVLFAVLEIAAVGVLGLLPRSASPHSAEEVFADQSAQEHSYYRESDWSGAFWDEHGRAEERSTYSPYTLWRSAPFDGRHVNIDDEGFRKTPGDDVSGARDVAVFGGSSVWGWGCPDWGTVPAYLQQQMTETGVISAVQNRGQNGFVSTQEVIELIRLLQSGRTPDVVVFLHGFNDAYATFTTREAGVHYSPERIAAKLEREGEPGTGSHVIGLLRATNAWTLLQRLMGRRAAAPPGAIELDEASQVELAKAAADAYLVNYRLVSGLADQHGFEFAFFWQPYLLAGAKPLTEEEEQFTNQEYIRPSFPFLKKLDDRIAGAAERFEHLYYLGDVFDDVEESVWIDVVHLSPRGNELIAERMLEDLGE